MQLGCWGRLACSLEYVSVSLSNPPAAFSTILSNCPFVPKQFCFANAKGGSLGQHCCSSAFPSGGEEEQEKRGIQINPANPL